MEKKEERRGDLIEVWCAHGQACVWHAARRRFHKELKLCSLSSLSSPLSSHCLEKAREREATLETQTNKQTKFYRLVSFGERKIKEKAVVSAIFHVVLLCSLIFSK